MNAKEALEKLTNYKCSSMSEKNECKGIIEYALKEYEEHEKLLKEYGFNLANFREACFTLAQFRGSGFINIERKLKALEIIKKKNVDIGYFREDFVRNNYGFDLYEDYPTNYHYGTDEPCFEYKGEFLTKEEFDLLKEYLE